MYLNSGFMANSHGYQQPAQHSHYSSGPPPKKRRATVSKVTPHIQSAPLPTPTSGTYPPSVKASRASDAGTSDTASHPSPGDTRTNLPPTATSLPSTGGLSIPFSPNFSFSPLPQFASLAPSPVPRLATLDAHKTSSTHATTDAHFDPMLNLPTPHDQQATPGAGSTSGASAHTDAESKDPFLSLLEQLAENEISRGGPSELDFFLGGQGA
jgi:hypothetical protein